MIWARDYCDRVRIRPTPDARGLCPTCGSELIAKCGHIKQWHWAHRSGSDCDTWAEGETSWHYGWKCAFPDEWQEVNIRGLHRADIMTKYGVVLELQHSSISVEEIQERERFYGFKMKWIIDGGPFLERIRFHRRDGFWAFYWKHARLTWTFAKREVFIDVRDGNLFQIRKNYGSRGWGQFISREEMLRKLGGDMASEFEDVLANCCPQCERNNCYHRLLEDGVEHRTCYWCGCEYRLDLW